MYLYDQAGYMSTLDNMLYKQRMQEPTQHVYAPHIDPFYQPDDPHKLKDYMDRVSRENLEAKNKLYQAHMRMQSLQASQIQHSFTNYSPQSPQDLYQQQLQMQSHMQLQFPQQFHPNLQQVLYQQSPQLQQLQLQQIAIAQQQLAQQPQPSPLSLQLVPTTPSYSVPSTLSTVPQQLTPQQVYQIQHAVQQKKTEAFSRNKEKLSQMAQLPYGWQFDPNVPLVNLDGTPTAQMRGIILSVFKRFDVDRDFELSLPEANQLNATARVQPISDDEFIKITKLYAAFLEEDGVPHGIHPEALISMFTTNMIECPEVTYLEMKNLGYEVNKAILPRGQERLQMKAAFLSFLKSHASLVLHQLYEISPSNSPHFSRHVPTPIPSPIASPHVPTPIHTPVPIPSPVQPVPYISHTAPPLNQNQFTPPALSSSPPVTISASTCSKCQSPYCVGVC